MMFWKRLSLWGGQPQVRWSLLVCLALAVGVLVSLDSWVMWWRSEAVWGTHRVLVTDTHRHILFAQARSIMSGHSFVADSQLYEYRDGFPMTPWPWLPAYFYAVMWKLFGTVWFLPFSTLMVGAASFLILVQIMRDMTRRWSLAVIASLLTFCTRLLPLFVFPANTSELKVLINTFLPGLFSVVVARSDFLAYESSNPTWLIFGPALFLLHRTLNMNRPRLLVWVGALCGILVYCYPFHWIYMNAVLALILLGSLSMRQWRWAAYVAAAMAVGGVVSVPYVMNQYLLSRAGILEDINLRNAGFEFGHFIRWSQWEWYVVWAAVAALVLWVARRRRQWGTGIFLVVLLAGGVVGLNMQVLTGFNIQADHWLTKVVYLPLGWALWYICAAGVEWLDKKRWVPISITISLLGIALFGPVTAAVQDQFTRPNAWLQNTNITADTFRAYEWIDTYLPRDAVVLALADDTATHLTLHTHARSFLPHALDTFAGEAEITTRFWAAYHLFGVPEAFLSGQLHEDESWRRTHAPFVGPNDFGLRKRMFWVRYNSKNEDSFIRGAPAKLEERVITELLASYAAFSDDLATIRQRYALDYVLSQPYDRLAGTVDLASRPDMEEVFRSGEVVIYRILPARVRI